MVYAEASKYKNTLRFVKFLVSCGADVNCVTVNTGPLHAAINSGSLDVLKYLLGQSNIDVNQQTLSTFESPLHIAYRKGDVRFIEILLNKGASKSVYNLVDWNKGI